jgi:hypothetical protein
VCQAQHKLSKARENLTEMGQNKRLVIGVMDAGDQHLQDIAQVNGPVS